MLLSVRRIRSVSPLTAHSDHIVPSIFVYKIWYTGGLGQVGVSLGWSIPPGGVGMGSLVNHCPGVGGPSDRHVAGRLSSFIVYLKDKLVGPHVLRVTTNFLTIYSIEWGWGREAKWVGRG